MKSCPRPVGPVQGRWNKRGENHARDSLTLGSCRFSQGISRRIQRHVNLRDQTVWSENCTWSSGSGRSGARIPRGTLRPDALVAEFRVGTRRSDAARGAATPGGGQKVEGRDAREVLNVSDVKWPSFYSDSQIGETRNANCR